MSNRAAATATAALDDGATTGTAALQAAPPETAPLPAPMSTKKRVEALYNVMGTIEVRLLRRRRRRVERAKEVVSREQNDRS
jgi:hypothetical protein